MKNLKLFGILLVTCFLVGVTNVNAAEVTEVSDESGLSDCVWPEDLSVATSCKLTSDIELSGTLYVLGNATVDLNGYKITYSGASNNMGLIYLWDDSSLTINDSSTTKTGLVDGTNEYAGIQLNAGSTLTVNGGTIKGSAFGITGFGANQNNTTIIINGGNIKGIAGAGIYHPQNGSLEVTGGVIEGTSGIEMRAGSLEVTGGTIKATATDITVNPNGSGTTTEGAGIAVAQHTTKFDVDVKINGGTIEGAVALYQSNPQNNDATSISKVTMEVISGTLTSTKGASGEAIYSENVSNVVTGNPTITGTVEGAKKVTVSNEDTKGTVTVSVPSDENNTSITGVKTAQAGKEVSVAVSGLADGIKNAVITVTKASGANVEVTDGKFIMPDEDVTITITYVEYTVDVTVNIDYSEEDKEYFDEDGTIFAETVTEDAENIVLNSVKDSIGITNKDVNIYYELYGWVFTDKEMDELISNIEDDLSSDPDNQELIEDLEKAKAFRDAVKSLNAKIGGNVNTLFDVYDITNDTPLEGIDALNSPIKSKLFLPSELRNVDKKYLRTFYIVRMVDGEVVTEKAALNADGSIYYESDKVDEKFLIAYVDTINPATYDAGIGAYAGLGLLSLISLVSLALYTKKKLFN